MILLFIVLSAIVSSCNSEPGHHNQKNELSIMTFNVRNGRGMDDKVDYARTAKVIARYHPDVVALQELDSVTKRSGGDNVLEKIAGVAEYKSAYAAAIPFDGGKYGVGSLFREQPVQFYNIPLPGEEEQRTLQVIEFSSFVLFNAHLSLTEADRNRSGEIINEERKKFTKPVFLTGDLNAEPASTLITSLKKKWKQLSPDAFTFPASIPDEQLDYIFVSAERASAFEIISSEVVADSLTSDHRPVVVRLRKK